jgi:hypothetical protein
MQLFLKKNNVLSLDEASSSIFDENDEGETLFKSKVRTFHTILTKL